jgi:hypothetical protein
MADDPEAYKMTEHILGPEDGGEEKDEGKVDMDIRMDKLPEAPKGMRGGAGMTSQNTGPKGVKADFEEAKKNMATQRYRENLQRQAALERKAYGQARFELDEAGAGAGAGAAAAPAKKPVEKKKVRRLRAAAFADSPSLIRVMIRIPILLSWMMTMTTRRSQRFARSG